MDPPNELSEIPLRAASHDHRARMIEDCERVVRRRHCRRTAWRRKRAYECLRRRGYEDTAQPAAPPSRYPRSEFHHLGVWTLGEECDDRFELRGVHRRGVGHFDHPPANVATMERHTDEVADDGHHAQIRRNLVVEDAIETGDVGDDRDDVHVRPGASGQTYLSFSALARSSSLLNFSQVKEAPERPKWPYAAVWR